MFVSDLTEAGLSGESKRLSLFWDIFEILKRHDFGIMAGVDSADVLGFVGWVEF
jgi:hypothetical protein